MMRPRLTRFLPAALAGVLAPLCLAGSAFAQEAAAPPAVDSGDTAWVLASSALVLMMTLPGLALFYGGLVRVKNVLNVLVQCFFCAGVVGVLWILVGYSLAFSGTGTFVGDLGKVGLAGVTMDSVTANFASPPRNIPEYIFIMFQAMFAIITPGLIIGAVAERMKFSVFVAFITLWVLLVYCPLAHMVWGGGWIFAAGAIDFAGGLVVHMSSGYSALVAAILVGSRRGFGKRADAAAQSAALSHRRRPAVDGMVRLQRRQRAQRQPAGDAGLPEHQHGGVDGDDHLGGDRMDAPRQADRARRRDRRGRRSGRDHARPAATSARWARSPSASACRWSATSPSRS